MMLGNDHARCLKEVVGVIEGWRMSDTTEDRAINCSKDENRDGILHMPTHKPFALNSASVHVSDKVVGRRRVLIQLPPYSSDRESNKKAGTYGIRV